MGLACIAKVSELLAIALVFTVKAWAFAVMDLVLLVMAWDVAVKALVLVV